MKSLPLTPVLAVAALVALCACKDSTSTDAKAEPATASATKGETTKTGDHTDGKGAAAKAPTRYVTLGGAVTEVVYALGKGPLVVGTDTSTTFPPEAVKLPKVGFFRKLSAEGILSLKPTEILATKGISPASAVDQLKATGLQITTFTGAEGVDAAKARISAIGKHLGEEAKAKELNASIDSKIAAIKARAAKAKTKPKVLFVYARGPNLLMISGAKTAADSMLVLAGATNAVVGVEGFKPMTPEAVVKAAPDVVIMPTKGAESLGGADKIFAMPGLSETPAGKNKRLVTVDDAMLLNFGPRFPDALTELQTKLKIGSDTDDVAK